MYSLLINDSTQEFYYNNEPIKTLHNIKMINLFIGANNSRKSRFVRKIAVGEKQLIVNSVTSYEDLLELTQKLIERIKTFDAPNPDLSLLDYQGTRRETLKNKRFDRLKEYFDNESKSNTTYLRLAEHLEEIINKLQTIKSDQDITDIKESDDILFSFFDLLVFVYTEAMDGKQIGPINNHQEWLEENLNAIDFRVGDRDSQGKIKDIEDKIHLFMDIRILVKKISIIKIQLWTGRASYIPVLRSSRNFIDEKHTPMGNRVFETTISHQYFNDIKPPAHLDWKKQFRCPLLANSLYFTKSHRISTKGGQYKIGQLGSLSVVYPVWSASDLVASFSSPFNGYLLMPLSNW